MCLYVKDREVKIATEDIPVRKRLSLWKDGRFHIIAATPVMDMYVGRLWELRGKEIKPRDPYNDFEELQAVFNDPTSTLRIERGFVHTYTKSFPDEYSPGAIMVEAIIPKGAHYIVGKSNDIAAERIIIKKIPWWNIIKEIIKGNI